MGASSSVASSSSGTPVVDGWTVFTPANGALVIHVASNGDDGNPGTAQLPKATVEAGYEALRDGQADWLLLRRGDTFALSSSLVWTKTGPAAADAGWMRLGAYGDEALPRPTLNSGVQGAMIMTPGYQSTRVIAHVALTDVRMVAQGRLDAPLNAPSAGALATVAAEYQGSGFPFSHLLLENVVIDGFSFGYSGGGDVEDLRVRRCVFTRIFLPGGGGTHSSGLLTGAQGVLLEENVFYLNQHPDLPGVTEISFFAHSAYLTAQSTNVRVLGNYIIKATEGFMVRPGGVYERNISISNEIPGHFGQAWGVVPAAGGVTLSVRENLFLNGNGTVNVGNARQGVVESNLILRGPEGTVNSGVSLIGYNEQFNGATLLGANVGVHDVAFTGNVLAGDFSYTNPQGETQSYTGNTFMGNTTGVATSTTIAGFLTSLGRSGTTVDDWAAELVSRDRANFREEHRTRAMLNHYRAGAGLPLLQ